MLNGVASQYREALLDTDRERALSVIAQARERGVPPEDIVFGLVIPAIHSMLESSTGESGCLAQHFMTAQISAEIVEQMLPHFETRPQTPGRVVLGTSHGDFHGLGRKIVAGCLRAQTYEVIDLGMNVPPGRFVDEAVACGAEVIGISSMMVHTARGELGCLRVRQVLQERGLEPRIKLVVGGAPYRFDENLYRHVGADAWAATAIEAGRVVAGLIQEVDRR